MRPQFFGQRWPGRGAGSGPPQPGWHATSLAKNWGALTHPRGRGGALAAALAGGDAEAAIAAISATHGGASGHWGAAGEAVLRRVRSGCWDLRLNGKKNPRGPHGPLSGRRYLDHGVKRQRVFSGFRQIKSTRSLARTKTGGRRIDAIPRAHYRSDRGRSIMKKFKNVDGVEGGGRS